MVVEGGDGGRCGFHEGESLLGWIGLSDGTDGLHIYSEQCWPWLL